MRRCGSTFCLVLVGLLAAATAAGGAYAAAGGNQGKGHAWAKGRAKHAAATPQLSQPPVKAIQQAPKKKEAPAAAKNSPPGAVTRHVHLTICHRTGSGRYIVISPSINGALNGHLRHHDDFPYVHGCSRRDPVPAPNPAPEPGPKPPAEGTSVEASPATAIAFRGELPYTGLPFALIAAGGALLLATGLAVRLTARSRPKVI